MSATPGSTTRTHKRQGCFTVDDGLTAESEGQQSSSADCGADMGRESLYVSGVLEKHRRKLPPLKRSGRYIHSANSRLWFASSR